MRKVFIDIGGWNGASAVFFRKYHPSGRDFEIFTFECDKKNIETIKGKQLPITLIEKAAWNRNGVINFYPGGMMPGSGGTLYKEKTTGRVNPNKFYKVETIDIAEFMFDNFTEDDYIIMKMNCEGAEYEIIPHLEHNGLIGWVDKWFVQWHYDKIKMSKAEHEEVVKMLPSYFDWDCQCNEKTFKDRFLKALQV